MMTGLYGATKESDLKTVKEFIKISPDTVRIYPTVVIAGTKLADYVQSGKYIPETVETAVDNCCEYIKLFEENHINVIRVGLHHIDEESFVAGPWHPAFSELCMSKTFYRKVIMELEKKPIGNYVLYVNDKFISAAVGQKKSNIEKLKEKGFNCRVKGDKNLKENQFKIERDVK
jgi:histone acetyltransferase (RNA polymerase elongator complex component)